MIAGPIVIEADVDHADESTGGPLKDLAGDERLHRGGAPRLRVHIEIERLFPHWNEKDGVMRLAEIFLRNLQLDGLIGVLQRAEQRRRGFAHLEIDGAVLDLHDHVVVELAVQLLEIVVGGARAVVLGIVPIHVMVVDEAAIKDETAVRLECARDNVGGVGVSAAVGGWSHAAFGIGLQNEAAEIGDGAVDFIGSRFPPRGDARVERIERIEAAHALRTAEVDREGDAHAPGTHRVGDAGDVGNQIGPEQLRVGVDVVDGAAVDAERGQQAGVIAGAGKIGAGAHVVPENGTSAVSALDGAVEIVPLIDPADGGVGSFALVEIVDRIRRAESCEAERKRRRALRDHWLR